MRITAEVRLFEEGIRHRNLFAARLESALRNSECPLIAAAVAREYRNHYPKDALSVSTVRRWLAAATYPSEQRIVALSVWLGVDAVWLRYGNEIAGGPKQKIIESIHGAIPHMDAQELALLQSMLDVVISCRWHRVRSVCASLP